MFHIQNVQKILKEHQLSALIVDNPIDLYYLTGKDFSLGRLIIEEHQATLFVDGRYYESACALSALTVLLTSGYGEKSAFFHWWSLFGKRVGFDTDYTTYAAFEGMQPLGAEWIALKSPLKKLREIKDSSEIESLRRAADLGSKGFDFVCSLLKVGVSEQEIARELKIFWLKAGADKLSFEPHIAFGEGASQPHYHPGARRLKEGDCVLIDIGVVWEHYHSDMTRVVAFGNPSEEMQKIYEVVYAAYCEAVALCKPGEKILTIDQAARGWIDKKGYGKYFTHSLGHGVGLEIHELPRVSSLASFDNYSLQEGMVLTIEPGIYLPGIGGVRLEDTLVITTTGCENLTKRPIPTKLPIIDVDI